MNNNNGIILTNSSLNKIYGEKNREFCEFCFMKRKGRIQFHDIPDQNSGDSGEYSRETVSQLFQSEVLCENDMKRRSIEDN